MKFNRSGQATPFTRESYRLVRSNFEQRHHRLLFVLAWHTLERWGALLKLQVDDVYRVPEKRIPRTTIVIPASYRKDRKTREVSVSKALERELSSYYPPGRSWLFPSPHDPGCHLSLRAADFALREALKKSGLDHLGYSTHSTRRGGITLLAEEGMHPRVIQAVSGHASLDVLSKYIEVSPKQKQVALSLLE
jgi:integrase/recombinase XerD